MCTKLQRIGAKEIKIQTRRLAGQGVQALGQHNAYGKMVEAVEGQTTVNYTKDKRVFMKDLRLVWIQDVQEIATYTK